MDKKTKLCVAAAAAAVGAVALPVFLTAPRMGQKRKKAPFVGVYYAHRGLHTADCSVPENSIAAFKAAARAGYGVELDVQLTKDGQVVVFHDDTLDRVCGVHGRVDEYTFLELQEFRLSGTEERIPLFADVLAAVRGCSALIVELKRGRKNKELCEKTLALLRSYKGDVCIESFDPGIVMWFRRHARDIVRGQLATEMDGYKDTLSRPKAYIMSRCLLNFLTRPDFIAYKLCKRPLPVRLSELLGAMRFCWTSRAFGDEKGHDGVIFEYYTPKLRFK